MNSDDLAKLVSQSDQTDIQALLTAKENAKKNMLDDASQANISAFKQAKKALDEFLTPDDQELIFDNKMEALKWLKAEGYKIGKSKLYNDAAAGRLKQQAGGKIKEKDVKLYIKRARLVRPEKIPDAGTDEMTKQKLQLEIRKLEEDVKEKEIKNLALVGKYMPKADVYMQLASRAVAFDAGLKHRFNTEADEVVESLSGIKEHHRRVAIVRQWAITNINEQLNDFADVKTFQAVILKEAESAD